MSNLKKFILSLVVLLTITGLVVGMLIPVPARAASIQPELKQLAMEMPDKVISVIAQKADTSQRAEKLVGKLGGMVTKDLHIINAFAAEISANAAVKLAKSATVRWVSLDGAVESTGKPPKDDRGGTTSNETLRDEFIAASYSNNDGTQSWRGNWQEVGDDGSPDTGGIRVQDRVDCTSPNCLLLRPMASMGAALNSYIWREADLSGATNATLTYDFGSQQYYGGGQVAVEISADGGETWVTLVTHSVDAFTSSGNAFDISAYMSSNTRIRFRFTELVSSNSRIGFDNVQISYTTSSDVSDSANTYLDTLGVRDVWALGYQGQGIGIAVIDSGVDHGDLSQQVVFESAFNGDNNLLDNTGHGTHVAGIIAGDGTGSNGVYVGVAPEANILALNVSDNNGMAYESDVVAAMQWVYDNKDAYNIRILNVSINSTVSGSYHESPMNAAAEILWFNGVVVIVAAGNSGTDAQIDTIQSAPANDPFLITVGATDEQGNSKKQNDVIPTFSASGWTLDDYWKPEIFAPGVDIISTLPTYSGWKTDYPDRVTKIGNKHYFRASGTSMAAPMVTGAAALLLQAEPDLTPDQVKFRLTWCASVINGYSYLDVYEALTWPTYGSANTGLVASQLLWSGDDPVAWDSVSWNSVSWNSVSWNSVAWNSVSWNSVAWNSVSWNR